jgi:LacI family transcriptional regulator
VGALTRGLADGILLILPTNADAYLEGLQRQGFPYMLVDHQGSGDYRRSVRSTNHQGAFDAVRHLIDIGHRRIGHITGELSVGAASDRLAGYRAALMMAGLPVDPALVVPGNFHQTTGYSGAQALLSLPEPPTAIFVGNDHMAFGVMEAARVRGLRIPEDLSIIGFDDIPQALIVHPPLTTVKQPLEQMGRVAAETLLRLIDGDEDVVTQVVLPTELILRYTCCPPAAAPPQGG